MVGLFSLPPPLIPLPPLVLQSPFFCRGFFSADEEKKAVGGVPLFPLLPAQAAAAAAEDVASPRGSPQIFFSQVLVEEMGGAREEEGEEGVPEGKEKEGE